MKRTEMKSNTPTRTHYTNIDILKTDRQQISISKQQVIKMSLTYYAAGAQTIIDDDDVLLRWFLTPYGIIKL